MAIVRELGDRVSKKIRFAPHRRFNAKMRRRSEQVGAIH
jgi:hypothetical protein